MAINRPRLATPKATGTRQFFPGVSARMTSYLPGTPRFYVEDGVLIEEPQDPIFQGQTLFYRKAQNGVCHMYVVVEIEGELLWKKASGRGTAKGGSYAPLDQMVDP